MKKNIWKKDWFLALLITVVFFVFANNSLILGLEWSVYDLGVRMSDRDPGNKVAVIAVDDESIQNIGRWPWSRNVFAKLITMLSEGGARVISNTILYTEPQLDPGLAKINQALDFYQSSGLANSGNRNISELGNMLAQYQKDLDSDAQLSASVQQAGNVLLGTLFTIAPGGAVLGKPDKPLDEYLLRNKITAVNPEATTNMVSAEKIIPPIPQLGNTAAGIGHLNLEYFVDGHVRTELLAINYYGTVFPSLSLVTAARSLNLSPEDIKMEADRKITFGGLTIPVDASARMYPFFYSPRSGRSPFQQDSFYDVYAGKIPVSKYKDKIVIIGATAAGVGTPLISPLAEPIQPAIFMAHTVASILNQDFFVVPQWAGFVQGRFGIVFLAVALYLILVLPRLSAGRAALTSFVLLLVLLGSSLYLQVSNGLIIQLMLPSCLLVCGYILLVSKRYLVTESGKIRSDMQSAESNLMLGLAFQQQGQLDMALDKFRKCPMGDDMLEPFYNLALDYESKRQFNKATSIYQQLATYNPKYRDVDQKMKASKAMSETFIFGGSPQAGAAGTMVVDGMQKPKLGRYEVEKELGKGAMGTVYLGKDPKINRMVAIKTMALSQEFEESDLAQVKSRFFQEAETAGRLTHPNIVSIYDAGEEHDLAYIAMEFLKGHDLNRYTKKDNLFPVEKVIEMTAIAADALDYAHSQNVIHRDIKPANIMFNPDENKIKITDFGIARISDSSRTKTGMVLGTPSYMSPEQVAGKKIDGRSDLFSLGIMFYQLLCGELPFKSDTMTSLMFKIANDPYPDINTIRPELADIAPCLSTILKKALAKKPEERFQRGSDMANIIRKCGAMVKPAQV